MGDQLSRAGDATNAAEMRILGKQGRLFGKSLIEGQGRRGVVLGDMLSNSPTIVMRRPGPN